MQPIHQIILMFSGYFISPICHIYDFQSARNNNKMNVFWAYAKKNGENGILILQIERKNQGIPEKKWTTRLNILTELTELTESYPQKKHPNGRICRCKSEIFCKKSFLGDLFLRDSFQENCSRKPIKKMLFLNQL